VIGSNRGGLSQAIGPGGIVLPHDAPTEEWVDALRKLWSNEDAYNDLSKTALDYAKRPELDFKRQHEAFLSVLNRAVSQQNVRCLA
jgi:glycosyltransferase involved in cell wall biosynthesis